MIDTLPVQEHQYPHQRDDIVSREDLGADFANHPDAYHPGLHPFIESHLWVGERPETAVQAGEEFTARLVAALDTDVAGWISEERLSELLSGLKDKQGEIAPGGAKAILDITKQILSQDKVVPLQFYSALSDHPELIVGAVEQAGSEQATDWDQVAAWVTAEACAGQLKNWREAQKLPDGPWGEPKLLTEDQEHVAVEKEAMAAQLLRVSAELPGSSVDAWRLRGIFAEYSSMESAGVTFEEAVQFNRLKPVHSRAAGPSPGQLKDTIQKYNSSSEQVRIVFGSGYNDPIRVAAMYDMLEVVADSSENAHDRVKAFAEISGCREIMSEEYAAGARQTIESLLGQGAKPEGIIDLIGDQEQMQTIINHAALSDPEAHQRSLDLMAQLARHDIISEFPQVVKGDNGVSRDRVITHLLQSPDKFARYVGAVDGQVDTVVASGFPSRITAGAVFYRFSDYYGNLRVTDDVAHITSLLEKQQAVGGSLQPIETLNPTLVNRLAGSAESLERLDSAEIISVANSLATLMKEHPEVYGLIKQDLESADSLEGIACQLNLADGVMRHAEIFSMLEERDKGKYSTSITQDFVNLMNRPSAEKITQTFAALERARDLLTDERLQDHHSLMRACMNNVNANAVIDLFSSESIQSRLDNEAMRIAIGKATGIMTVRIGRYDIESNLKTIESMTDPDKEWLSDLVYWEAQLRHEGLDEKGVREFRELFMEAMPRKDKDGNYYDAPESLRLAIVDTYYSRYIDGRYSPEDLLWYRASEMPIAGYTTVAVWRRKAVENGVADTPQAVYEWMHQDPEQVAMISRGNLADYVENKLFEGDKQAAQEAIATARAELRQRNEHFRTFLNISTDALLSANASGGAIKSMLDAGVEVIDRDRAYKLRRSGVEVALGLRSMNSDAPHPIYGSSGFIDKEIPTGAVGYGDIMIAYKETPDQAARTTYTPEDSFHGAHRLTSEDAKILRLVKDAKEIGHMRTSEYVESQIRGGVTLEAADAIYVPTQKQHEALTAQLPANIAAKIVLREK